MSNKKSVKPEDRRKVPPPPPPRSHDVPPHILKEIFDLKEKVGQLEGKIDILFRLKSK